MNNTDIALSMTVGQILALRLLCREGSACPTDLSKETRSSRSSITGLKDKFLKHGLIEMKHDSEDRRRLVLTPTEKGREVHNEMNALLWLSEWPGPAGPPREHSERSD